MSEPPPAAPPALPRFSTGIPGLDIALGGGLLRGGLYLVEGQPGAGKTILGNQLAFAHVAAGGRAVYVTLLTEAHSRMLGHLRPLTFYDEAVIGDALVYLSGTGPLEEGGLPALLTLLHAALRQRRATLLVVDGLAVVAESAEAENPLRRFMVTLQSYMESIGGVALLLGRPLAGRADLAHTMVDGVLALRSEAVDVEVLRTAEVVKFRGAAHLRGRHAYAITDAGLVIYPRTEARYAAPAAVPAGDPLAPAASVGLPRLDAMLGGGLPRGAAMLVAGGAGTGKTPFGLHFLDAGARAGEAGLYFGFGEPPAALLAAAAGLGLTLRAAFDRGALAFVWQLPGVGAARRPRRAAAGSGGAPGGAPPRPRRARHPRAAGTAGRPAGELLGGVAAGIAAAGCDDGRDAAAARALRRAVHPPDRGAGRPVRHAALPAHGRAARAARPAGFRPEGARSRRRPDQPRVPPHRPRYPDRRDGRRRGGCSGGPGAGGRRWCGRCWSLRTSRASRTC